MSRNKDTVKKYMDAFTRTDAFHVTGKEAFDLEIEDEAFVGARR